MKFLGAHLKSGERARKNWSTLADAARIESHHYRFTPREHSTTTGVFFFFFFVPYSEGSPYSTGGRSLHVSDEGSLHADVGSLYADVRAHD